MTIFLTKSSFFSLLILVFCSITASAQETSCEIFTWEAIRIDNFENDPSKAEALFVAARNTSAGCSERTYQNLLQSLGAFYVRRQRFYEAVPLLEEAVGFTKEKGLKDFGLPKDLLNLALAYQNLGILGRAEECHKERIEFMEKRFGCESRGVVGALREYADFLREVNLDAEAEEVELRVKEIIKKQEKKEAQTDEVEAQN